MCKIWCLCHRCESEVLNSISQHWKVRKQGKFQKVDICHIFSCLKDIDYWTYALFYRIRRQCVFDNSPLENYNRWTKIEMFFKQLIKGVFLFRLWGAYLFFLRLVFCLFALDKRDGFLISLLLFLSKLQANFNSNNQP